MPMLNDGTGDSYAQKVNSRHFAHVFGVTETENIDAARLGNAYNINTGLIAFSTNSTTRTSILYFKNDETEDYVISAIAIGLGTRSATVSDFANVYVVRNPTAGTIITNASAVAMKSNANFGSNKTLQSTTLAYKGADGDGATTGGTDHALLGMSDGRLYGTLPIVLPRGSSIALEIDGNTSGTFNVYAALIGYVRDGSFDD